MIFVCNNFASRDGVAKLFGITDGGDAAITTMFFSPCLSYWRRTYLSLSVTSTYSLSGRYTNFSLVLSPILQSVNYQHVQTLSESGASTRRDSDDVLPLSYRGGLLRLFSASSAMSSVSA